jgi:hypothetical protein
MKAKSVWLHTPMGNPKKTQFKVTESEISLGNFVVPVSEVQSCKVGYPKKWLAPLTATIGLSLLAWFAYEVVSLVIRFSTAINVASTPGVDEAASHASMVQLLEKLHLRASTSDDQQLALTFWIYIFLFVYGILISPLIFRPRIVLTARGGSVVEMAYRFVRPRKFAKTLAAARKVAKRNKKVTPNI